MTDGKDGRRLRRALCVVPDQDTFDLLRSQLLDRSYEADYAAGVSAALEAARSGAYDIYVVEHWWLTDGHGLEFCREVRRSDTTTPVLFYSRNVLRIEISQALAAGAQAYISLSEALPRRVEQLVEAAEARDREALKEETRCIREHLLARWQGAGERRQASEKHFYQALHDGLRAHALAEFVRAGGKRALFEQLYQKAVEDATALVVNLPPGRKPKTSA